MKKVSFILIFSIFLAFCNELLAQNKGLTSGKQYTFTETYVMPKMNKTTEKKGVMVFTTPDRLTMDYTKPEGDYTHITAEAFDVFKNGKLQRFPMNNPKHRMAIFRATLLYCLGGEVNKAAELNQASKSYSTEGKTRLCTLAVEKAAPRDIAKLVLEYDVKTEQLRAITITEGNGNYTSYRINTP